MHKGLDAFRLKLLMAILMLLDHLYYPFGEICPVLYWGHIAARVVAPVFCFFMTEGMRYTRSRSRYIFRLGIAGAVMWAGNVLLEQGFGEPIPNNIFLPLAVSAAMIGCIDCALEQTQITVRLGLSVAAVGLLMLSVPMEGSVMLPLMALIFYYLREKPTAMWLVYLSFGAFCAGELLSVLTGQAASVSDQFWMILAVIPIGLYSGERGRNTALARWFFYVFYPVHIWAIYLIEQVFAGG